MKPIFEIRKYKNLHSKFNEHDDFIRSSDFELAKTFFFDEARVSQAYQKIILVEFQADKAVVWYTFERNYPQTNK
ncbi:MAG: hypothetical protein K6G73_12285 [Marinilabiliaceae bacterium]|nr:hypothetical protein [Marinilabiliaceae bacterium]